MKYTDCARYVKVKRRASLHRMVQGAVARFGTGNGNGYSVISGAGEAVLLGRGGRKVPDTCLSPPTNGWEADFFIADFPRTEYLYNQDRE